MDAVYLEAIRETSNNMKSGFIKTESGTLVFRLLSKRQMEQAWQLAGHTLEVLINEIERQK